jgi:hypothetical protein
MTQLRVCVDQFVELTSSVNPTQQQKYDSRLTEYRSTGGLQNSYIRAMLVMILFLRTHYQSKSL